MLTYTIALGLIASIITEFFKLFPILSSTDTRKRVVAFLISTALAFFYVISQPGFVIGDIFTMMVTVIGLSFAAYKLVLQPIVKIIRH